MSSDAGSKTKKITIGAGVGIAVTVIAIIIAWSNLQSTEAAKAELGSKIADFNQRYNNQISTESQLMDKISSYNQEAFNYNTAWGQYNAYGGTSDQLSQLVAEKNKLDQEFSDLSKARGDALAEDNALMQEQSSLNAQAMQLSIQETEQQQSFNDNMGKLQDALSQKSP